MPPITHAKVSGVADSPDTSLVRPSDWNDDHVGSAEILRETGGPTDLPIGAIAAGDFLRRVGAAIVGATIPPANPQALDVVTTDITVVNTVVETSIYSFLVPANTLGTNNLLRLRIHGTYLNNSGVARTLTIRLKYGATTLFARAAPVYFDAASLIPSMEFILKGDGADNAQRGQLGDCWMLTRYVGTGYGDALVGAEGTSPEDSTGALNLVVTVEHSAAHANLSFIRRAATLELMEAL